jgi:autotransporter-associated beta strand protein
LNTLLTNISVAASASTGLHGGATLGLDTSTAAGGTFTQGDPIANSTGTKGGPISVTKLGANTLVFDKTNTYTGATTVDAGTLAVTGSLSGTTAANVNSGGTLLLNGGSEKVNNAAIVTLGGGTLAFDTSATNQVETLGTLILSANSFIDFGLGGGDDDLSFSAIGGSFIPGTYTLAINNWDGTVSGGTLGSDDRLIFGGSVTDFTSRFGTNDVSFNGAPGYATISFGGGYEIVPVPEPATTALIGAVALCALIGYRERRRFSRKSGANSAA